MEGVLEFESLVAERYIVPEISLRTRGFSRDLSWDVGDLCSGGCCWERLGGLGIGLGPALVRSAERLGLRLVMEKIEQ